MYEHHFGLAKPPFRITPDPEFFFPGGNRGAVLEALVYAVGRGEGIVKVVGEVGSGKTMLCRMLERELPAECEIVYLANPCLAPGEILHAIAFELGLGVTPDDTKLKVQHLLHQYLLRRHAENRRVIMFVEEAQAMPLESLEEMRLLSNLETTREKLLQIVLFGQPELDEKLNVHEIRQLRERITHSFNLAAFDREQVRDYVNARLRASGYRHDDLFTPAAIRALGRHSEGLLRRINVLADKALLAAFASHDVVVKPAHIRLAVRDSEFGRPARWPLYIRVGAVGLILIGLMAGAWMLKSKREIVPSTADTGVQSAPEAGVSTKLKEVSGRSPPAASASAAVVVSRDEFAARRAPLPVISAVTGLVTNAHLAPRLEPRVVERPGARPVPAERP